MPRKYGNFLGRRGDRVADCAALEMLCGGNSTAGSNPALSAKRMCRKLRQPARGGITRHPVVVCAILDHYRANRHASPLRRILRVW